jgi:uncharacterized protein
VVYQHRKRYWASLLLIGATGGFLSGLFGVGGGILMVPMLVTFAGMDQRRASATSLLAILPTAIAGSASYLARGEADLVVAALVALGGIAGSWIGTWLLRRTSMGVLRWMFIGLIVVVAIRMLVSLPVRGDEVALTVELGVELVVVGVATGIASGLFGIGGGVIVVPALILLVGMGDLLAKGTSLLMMIPTSAAGSWANARSRVVDVRVGLVVGVSAVAASFCGVAVAFMIPERLSAGLFAALLAATAIQLTVRAVRKK